MADIADELQAYLNAHLDTLSDEERALIEKSIAELRSTPGAKVKNLDRYDAKGMTPEGQSHPVNWNPKKGGG